VQSVSGVTEAGTSSNAASGEKQARRRGGLDAGLLTVVERAAVDDGVGWEVGEVTTAAGDDNEEAAACSTARHTAARLGWLLLGRGRRGALPDASRVAGDVHGGSYLKI